MTRRTRTNINISFFAKGAFLNTNPRDKFVYNGTKPPKGAYIKRLSSTIRADQIAERIGAKLNPESGFENDICIYVKPPYKAGQDFEFAGKPYLDIVDATGYFELSKKNPHVSVIAASEWNYQLLKRALPNKIVLIPQQHCNFERQKRTRKQITTVGIIGNYKAFPYLPADLKNRLAERGMKLIEFSEFFTRQDVIDFYMQIDVQIVWRPYFDYRKAILMNSLKLQNSASFGIPTICYDEPVFEEMSGCYIGVRTLDEFLDQLDILRANPKLYKKYAKRCLEKAEEYHIDKIAELYKNLT